MLNDTFNHIVKQFAKGLVEAQLLNEKYFCYLFTFSEYKISESYLFLEHSEVTNRRDVINRGIESREPPFPRKKGSKLCFSFKNYRKFAFGIDGKVATWRSFLNDHESSHGQKFPGNQGYWQDKPVYYFSYEILNKRLLTLIIFDCNTTEPNEHKLLKLYLNPIFKRIEDVYYKNLIFSHDYLSSIQCWLNSGPFNSISQSVSNLDSNFTHDQNFYKTYYEFLFDNLSTFDKQLDPSSQIQLLLLTKEFEKNQKNLFRIQHYRDHYYHQCHVYLLGLTILSIFNKEFHFDLVEDFNKAYKPIDDHKYEKSDDIGAIWFLSAMYHDISYPIEKFGDWLDSFFQQYVYPKSNNKSLLDINLNLSPIMFDLSYSRFIEEIAEYQRKLIPKQINQNDKIDYIRIHSELSLINTACIFRNQLTKQIINTRDHGILSAIMLLSRLHNESNILRFLFPALSAISIHNFLWIDSTIFKKPCIHCLEKECTKCSCWNKSIVKYFNGWNITANKVLEKNQISSLVKISYKKHPVAFLLILCDLLQDWGRYEIENMADSLLTFNNPTFLTNIMVENNEIIFNIELKSAQNENNIEAFILHKKQEIASIFSMLSLDDEFNIIVKLNKSSDEPIIFSLKQYQNEHCS